MIGPDQQPGGASIGKPRREGWIDKTDALRRLEDHGGNALGLDYREIDADFVTMINVDYDIGHGRGDVRSGIEHRRDSHFLEGKGVVFIRINVSCQELNIAIAVRAEGTGHVASTAARSLATPTARPGTSATKSAPTTNGSPDTTRLFCATRCRNFPAVATSIHAGSWRYTSRSAGRVLADLRQR